MFFKCFKIKLVSFRSRCELVAPALSFNNYYFIGRSCSQVGCQVLAHEVAVRKMFETYFANYGSHLTGHARLTEYLFILNYIKIASSLVC